MCRIIPRVPHFLNMPHFPKFGAFSQVRLIFLSLAHFVKCASFFIVCRIFLLMCRTFPRLAHFSKCAALFQVCRTFPCVPHYSKCAAFSQVCNIFPSVSHFLKFVAIFQVCRIFPSVPQLSLYASFFQKYLELKSLAIRYFIGIIFIFLILFLSSALFCIGSNSNCVILFRRLKSQWPRTHHLYQADQKYKLLQTALKHWKESLSMNSLPPSSSSHHPYFERISRNANTCRPSLWL